MQNSIETSKFFEMFTISMGKSEKPRKKSQPKFWKSIFGMKNQYFLFRIFFLARYDHTTSENNTGVELIWLITERPGQTSTNPWILPSITTFSRAASYEYGYLRTCTCDNFFFYNIVSIIYIYLIILKIGFEVRNRKYSSRTYS